MSQIQLIENAESSGARVRHRLGIVGLPGFSPVPHLLLLHQHALELTSAELNVYLHVFMHWFDASRFPYPHTGTIAQRMGTTKRRVQQLINSLAKKGMLEKIPGVRKSDPKQYDVRPLLLKLQPQAREWMAQKEKAAQIERPLQLERLL
ncbi:MAG TPA: helix-turn-helix domain-containing protein [Xanthobacteraceae bacterium]|nr:helix-turn-helix domain-containing protein [Xanthobacteraceae bacterium]